MTQTSGPHEVCTNSSVSLNVCADRVDVVVRSAICEANPTGSVLVGKGPIDGAAGSKNTSTKDLLSCWAGDA